MLRNLLFVVASVLAFLSILPANGPDGPMPASPALQGYQAELRPSAPGVLYALLPAVEANVSAVFATKIPSLKPAAEDFCGECLTSFNGTNLSGPVQVTQPVADFHFRYNLIAYHGYCQLTGTDCLPIRTCAFSHMSVFAPPGQTVYVTVNGVPTGHTGSFGWGNIPLSGGPHVEMYGNPVTVLSCGDGNGLQVEFFFWPSLEYYDLTIKCSDCTRL